MEHPGSIGQRIKEVRGELSQKAFGARIGLSQTAVTALENDQSEPRLGTFNSIIEAFRVSPEWLRTGTGPMLRDGKALAPTPTPTPGLTSGPATVAVAENMVALAVAEVRLETQTKIIADQAQQIERLWAELGKSPGSSDAAGPTTAFPPTPPPVRVTGFLLGVQRRVRHRGQAEEGSR